MSTSSGADGEVRERGPELGVALFLAVIAGLVIADSLRIGGIAGAVNGDERNEGVHEVREEVVGAPDPCMETHFAYGSRAGIWRILDLFDAFGAKATFSACGRAVAATPLLAAEPHARGHEVSAHGWRWERLAGMPEPVERAASAMPSSSLASGWRRSAAPR